MKGEGLKAWLDRDGEGDSLTASPLRHLMRTLRRAVAAFLAIGLVCLVMTNTILLPPVQPGCSAHRGVLTCVSDAMQRVRMVLLHSLHAMQVRSCRRALIHAVLAAQSVRAPEAPVEIGLSECAAGALQALPPPHAHAHMHAHAHARTHTRLSLSSLV